MFNADATENFKIISMSIWVNFVSTVTFIKLIVAGSAQ